MPLIQKKICLLGEVSVGKTSLVRRYVEGRFDDRYLSSIGTKISRKTLELQMDAQALTMVLLVWDLAGGEKFNQMMTSYYRGASGAILVCDLTRLDTATALMDYGQDFWRVNPNRPIIVVGNKVDLIDFRVVTDEHLETVSTACQASFFTTSAKTGEQVETVFQTLGEQLLAFSDG